MIIRTKSKDRNPNLLKSSLLLTSINKYNEYDAQNWMAYSYCLVSESHIFITFTFTQMIQRTVSFTSFCATRYSKQLEYGVCGFFSYELEFGLNISYVISGSIPLVFPRFRRIIKRMGCNVRINHDSIEAFYVSTRM